MLNVSLPHTTDAIKIFTKTKLLICQFFGRLSFYKKPGTHVNSCQIGIG